MKPRNELYQSDWLSVKDGTTISLGKVEFAFAFSTNSIEVRPNNFRTVTTCYLTQVTAGPGKYNTYTGAAIKHNDDSNDPRLARVLALTRALIAYSNATVLAAVMAKRDANLKRLASKRLYELVLAKSQNER